LLQCLLHGARKGDNMYKNLEELRQEIVFSYFEQITKIPRCTGNEKGISDYLVDFANVRDLEVIQDDALNVIIKKQATPGYEHVPTVILQGHMDMVCEKNNDTEHDFNKDPLQLRVDGDMLYATNTTLGADNGIAVAYALALLGAQTTPHPALEVVITTEEETSMGGAFAVDSDHFEGKVLINLDSEEDHKLLVSSAGGVKAIQRAPITWEETEDDLTGFRITVGGLKGGHSGMSIHEERGNAAKIIGRFLHQLTDVPYLMQEINGGSAPNAIPREMNAVILIHQNNIQHLKDKIEAWNRLLKNELHASDPTILISLERMIPDTSNVFSQDTKHKTITSLMLIPNGVQSMSMEIKGLVESSTNLGIVSTSDKEIVFESDIRSSIKSLKEDIVARSKLAAELAGCHFMTDLDYPEWPYNPDSKIRKVFEKVHKEKYNTDAEIIAVHAGIECGIFIDKIPGLDAISIGPDIYDAHTPNEHISISSALNTWNYLLAVLEAMKEADL